MTEHSDVDRRSPDPHEPGHDMVAQTQRELAHRLRSKGDL